MNLDTEINEGTNEEDEGKDRQISKRDSERKFDKTKIVPDIQFLDVKRKLVCYDKFSLNWWRLVMIQIFLITLIDFTLLDI